MDAKAGKFGSFLLNGEAKVVSGKINAPRNALQR